MRELNHIGIPTSVPQANETYMEEAKLHITDFAASPNKIEWLRFEEGSPMPEILQKSAHIAYKVDDIKAAMEGKEVLLEPFSPMEGLTVAFIVEEGAPIELMQYAE
jgi:hypothetical protein